MERWFFHRSGTPLSPATRLGFCGSTNFRMLVTPRGPNTLDVGYLVCDPRPSIHTTKTLSKGQAVTDRRANE